MCACSWRNSAALSSSRPPIRRASRTRDPTRLRIAKLIVACGEIELLVTHFDGMGQQVERNSVVLVDRLLSSRLPTQQGAHARQQLVHSEWLGKIIIRADIEAAHTILAAVARAQDQNWF